jgi:hypothetical protein
MDCVIPGHSVRLFCSGLSCLSKICGMGGSGSDLYLEHDAAAGITLRVLNDARSAYCSMRFRPSFFDRCTSVSGVIDDDAMSDGDNDNEEEEDYGEGRTRRSNKGRKNWSNDSKHRDSSFSVRIAMRALAPVVKPRRDVVQLRITTLDVPATTKNSSARKRKGRRGEGLENDRRATVRPLRIAFEFLVASKLCNASSNSNSAVVGTTGEDAAAAVIRIVHCVPVASTDVDPIAAVAPRDGSSEIVCSPQSLLRLLEPLKSLRASEVALLVHRDGGTLTAQSFHHMDRCHFVPTQQPPSSEKGTERSVQLVLKQHQQGASAAVVKTEASMSVEELDDFYFRDDRGKENGASRWQGHEDEDPLLDLPDHVNDGVALVFPVREARAFLQFGSSFCTVLDPTTLRFHWGGRPVVFETSTTTAAGGGIRSFGAGSTPLLPPFESQLVLASLDHKLLASGGSGGENEGG